MDNLFKQKLLGLRNPPAPHTFAEALLGDTSWLKTTKKQSSKLEDVNRNKVTHVELSEDKKILEDELVIKSSENKIHSTIESLKSELKLSTHILDLILIEKVSGNIKVLFVSEKFRTWEEISTELKTGFINELIAGFPVKTAEFFEKMIMAMKLTSSEVIIYPIEGDDGSDFSIDVMSLAAFFRPEVVITLGAKATNRMLKSNDRLSVIHGQFFGKKMGDTSLQIVPLFHPSIIETNQNMKKTAWVDMQKVMKHLKKIP